MSKQSIFSYAQQWNKWKMPLFLKAEKEKQPGDLALENKCLPYFEAHVILEYFVGLEPLSTLTKCSDKGALDV